MKLHALTAVVVASCPTCLTSNVLWSSEEFDTDGRAFASPEAAEWFACGGCGAAYRMASVCRPNGREILGFREATEQEIAALAPHLRTELRKFQATHARPGN